MKTIPRNRTKVIGEVKAKSLPMRIYTLGNYFSGDAAKNPDYAWKLLDQGRAKLIDNENGTYTIHVHSNEWYELGDKPR